LHKSLVGSFGLGFALLAAACAERLESDAACPILCPGQGIALRDTVVGVDVIDTVATLDGFPGRGTGPFLILANSGDTLDTRVVIRFDSLLNRYTTGGTVILVTDISEPRLRLQVDSATSFALSDVTIEAFDVDSPAPDSAVTALLPLFVPERLLGSVTIAPGDVKDSIFIPLSHDAVLQKVLADTSLRIGLRVSSVDPVRVGILSANTSTFPRLLYDPAPEDEALGDVTIPPRSFTPVGDRRLSVDFTDYVIPAVGQPPLPPEVFGVGGIRGRRTYIRFVLPPRLTDSVTVVRATLVLTQHAAPTYGFEEDSAVVVPNVVLATTAVTDLAKAAMITDTTRFGGSIFGLQAVIVYPADEEEQHIELVNVVRFWRSASAERVPQAISLRSFAEGRSVIEAQFYSPFAAEHLRPRLLITYVPRTEFGIP
jgi:hypothetical protein